MMIKLCSSKLDDEDEDEVDPDKPKTNVTLPEEYAEYADVFNHACSQEKCKVKVKAVFIWVRDLRQSKRSGGGGEERKEGYHF